MPVYDAGTAAIRVKPSFKDFVTETKAELRRMDFSIDVRIGADTTAAAAEIDRLRHEAARNVTMGIDADTRVAASEIDLLRREAARNATMRVDADTSTAAAELAALRAAARQPIPIPLRPEVDRSATSRARGDVEKTAKDLTRDLDKALKGLKEAGTINLKVLGVVGAAGAIAELVSITGAAAKAAHTIALLPAIGFAGLAGAAGIATGLSGIPAAFKAATAASQDATANAEQQRQALTAVAEAQYTVTQSQQSLSDAYRDSTRSIRDMNNELTDQKLATEDAALSVQEAAQRLQKVQFDPTADATTRARAKLTYEQAVQRLSEQQNKTQDLQQDTETANAKGVEGSKAVVDAKHAEVKALEELRKATAALATPTGSQGKLDQAMAKLSPNAKELVNDIRALGPAWTDARKASQDALTQGMGPAVEHLAGVQLPNLRSGLVDVNSAINSGLRASIAALSSDTNKADFKTSLDNTSIGFANAAKGSGAWTDALTKLVTVGSTFLPQLGDAIANAADRFNNLIQRTAADGSLKKWIQDGIDATKELVQIVEHIGSSIGSVFKAAGDDGNTLKRLDDLTGRMSAFLKSTEGQGELKKFFSEARADMDKMKPVLADLPAVLHGVFEGFRTWSGIALPFLNAAGDLLSAHPGLVRDVVAAYLAFKTITPVVNLVQWAVGAVRLEMASLQASVGFTSGAMQAGFGSIAGYLGAAGIAIVAATGLAIGMSGEYRKASQQSDILSNSSRELAVNQREMAKAFQESNGAVSSNVLSSLSSQFDKVIADSGRLADTAPGAFSVFTGGFADIKGWFSGAAQAGTDAVNAQQKAADSGAHVRDSFKEVGLSSAEMARQISGSDAQFDSLVVKMRLTSNGGNDAEAAIRALRQEFQDAQRSAKDSTPGFFSLAGAVKSLSDESASASTRLNAMKTALDILSGKPIAAQDALAAYNQTVRDTAKVAQEWDKTAGTGLQLIDNGAVDTTTANGKRLFDTLSSIRDATLSAGVAGNDLGPRFAKNDELFQQLANSIGLSKDQVVQMAAQLGYLPTDIKMLASLQGAGDVTQQLTTIADLLTRNRDGVVIPAKALTDEARKALGDLVTIEQVAGHPDEIRIIAKTDEALAQLQGIAAFHLPDKTQMVKLEYDLSGFTLSQSDRQKMHEDISGIAIAPSGRATGGAISGGTAGRDSVPIMAMPGEHMLTTADVNKLGGQSGAYRFRAALQSGQIRGYATGGAIDETPQPANIGPDGNIVYPDQAGKGKQSPIGNAAAVQAFAASRNGQPYGGNEDCSGWISENANVAVGLPPNSGRMSTANEGPWLSALGFQTGSGATGTFRVGWVNNPSMAAGGHTAGTLPNNINIESGGATSKVMYGGQAIGAGASMFTQHAYLAMDGSTAGTGIPGDAASLTSQSQLNPQAPLPGRATDAQLQALSGKAAVDSANTERNAVYANPASTAQDKQASDIKYQQAQNSLESGAKKTDNSAISLQGIFSKAGGILATGLLSAFGLENSVLSDSNVYNKAFNGIVTGLGQNAQNGQPGGYAYQPQNLPSIATTSTPQSSAGVTDPSLATQIPGSGPITGALSVDPGLDPIGVKVPGVAPGYAVGAGAEQWRGLATQALIKEGFNSGQVNLMLSQIQSESGGNPAIVQQVQDVNSGGNEAVGLLQVIPGTFAQYRDPSLPNDRTNPSANMVAALRYYRSTYGTDLSTMWGQGHGYADGGWVDGPGGSRSDGIRARMSPGEFVVNAYDAARNSGTLEAINSSSWSPNRVTSDRFNPSAAAPAASAAPGYSPTINARVANVDDLAGLVERTAQMKAIGLMAALS